MAVNVHIDPAAMVEPMKGRRFAITQARYSDGSRAPWFNLTRPTSRNPIAQADTAAELTAWAKKQGARSAELID